MECRKGCGACCIALSISESFKNQPNGKKAGERCAAFKAEESWCGNNFEQAIKN